VHSNTAGQKKKGQPLSQDGWPFFFVFLQNWFRLKEAA
jgi:hypothetical protein